MKYKTRTIIKIILPTILFIVFQSCGGGLEDNGNANSAKPTHLNVSINGIIEDTMYNTNFITCIDTNNDSSCLKEKILITNNNSSFSLDFNNIKNTSHILLSEGSENNITNKKYNGSYMRIIDVNENTTIGNTNTINTTITPLSTIVAHIYEEERILNADYDIKESISKVANYFDLTSSQVLLNPIKNKKTYNATLLLMGAIRLLHHDISPNKSNAELKKAFDFTIKTISNTIKDNNKSSNPSRAKKESYIFINVANLMSELNGKTYNDKKIIITERTKINIKHIIEEHKVLVSYKSLDEMINKGKTIIALIASMSEPAISSKSSGGGGGGKGSKGGKGSSGDGGSVSAPSLNNLAIELFTHTQSPSIAFTNSGGSATSCSVSPTLPDGLNEEGYEVAPTLPKGLQVELKEGTCIISGVILDINTTITAITASNSGGSHTAVIGIKSHRPKLTGIRNVPIETTTLIYQIPNIDACTANPLLPNGLTLTTNSDNCSISGTSTISITETDIIITANNASTSELSILSLKIDTPSTGNLRTSSNNIDNQNDGHYKQGLARNFTRDDINNIVTDSTTSLIWQDDSEANTTKKNWTSSKTYCDNLTLGGHTDWSLPNVSELIGIINNSKTYPSSYDNFKNIASDSYWSDVSYEDNTSKAWAVDFSYGISGAKDKTSNYYARCVKRN